MATAQHKHYKIESESDLSVSERFQVKKDEQNEQKKKGKILKILKQSSFNALQLDYAFRLQLSMQLHYSPSFVPLRLLSRRSAMPATIQSRRAFDLCPLQLPRFSFISHS